MDKTKKRGAAACGGKQRAATSKGTRAKVDVCRHFDPTLKSKFCEGEEFPEVVLAENVSGRSTSVTPCKNRKIQKTPPSNYHEIQTVPKKRSISCDRKDGGGLMYSTSSSSSYSAPKKQLNRNNEKKLPTSTSSREMATKPKKSSHVEFYNPKIKDLLHVTNSKEKRTSRQCVSPQQTFLPLEDCENTLIVYRDPVVERLKEEIGMSAKACNDDVKQTVAELREEIAKYRKTLNRNVNYLQTKVRCGLKMDGVKEHAVQTESTAQMKEVEKFGALMTRIAELINLDDVTSEDRPASPRPQKVVSISTETVPPSRDPVVEKLKEEIGMSAKACNDDVKQTVAELREEIAKYRKTLNRNVNYLQTKVRCGLKMDGVKEHAVQTESTAQMNEVEKFGALMTRIAELINLGKESRKTHRSKTAPEKQTPTVLPTSTS